MGTDDRGPDLVAEPPSFGSRLRQLREAASLSQDELARRAQLTVHAVSALERGVRTRPYPHTARALADALQLSGQERSELLALVPSRRPAGRRTGREERRPSPLPAPPTPLVGRERDLAEVSALLRSETVRLVTLTGTGGVGKTRLAVAAASAVGDVFGRDVVFVELASVQDVSMVLPTVADRVATGHAERSDPASVVLDALGDRRVLLVLDNFEHVAAAAPQVASLMEACGGLTVLATSRAALRLRGEHVVVVPPLSLPEAGSGVEAVRRSAAGTLLLERARAVAPGLELTEANAGVLSRICVRVAGIPLALELAAARMRSLDPQTVLDRLDAALGSEGAHDLPARQRTMRAALDWSYRLLGAGEQALFRLLSVFSGAFTLADVEEVVARSRSVPVRDVIELLDALAGQSLLVTDRGEPGLTFCLLEPVAEYAAAALADAGEATAARRAHVDWFLHLAEEAAAHYERAQQLEWLSRVDAAHANLTAAMEHALADGDADAAGRIGWSLWLYWWLRGHLQHGRRMMEHVLAHHPRPPVRARAEIAAATMAFAQDDIDAARRHWQTALELAGDLAEPVVLADARAGVGLTDLAAGRLPEAREAFSASLPLTQGAGREGEWLTSLLHVWLGTVSLLEGDPDAAEEHVLAGLELARRRGDRLATYIALFNLSQIAARRDELDRARAHLQEGLRLSLETGDLANLAYFLDALGVVESRRGAHARVPLLVGAAAGMRERLATRGYGYYRPDERQAAEAVRVARRELGEERYDALFASGQSLQPQEAVVAGAGDDPDADD